MIHSTTKTQKKQGTTVLSRQEILETRELAVYIANSMTDRKLLTHMGIMNSLIWRAAIDYDAISRRESKYLINHEQWKNLLLCSTNGQVEITVPVDFTEDYLTKHWPGAFHNQVTVRTYRKQQLSWGLFWYDIDNRPKGAAWGHTHGVPCQGVATPPVLEKLDIAKVLIFYQVFDQVRRARIEDKLGLSSDITAFDCMPEHGGMLMVELYNALFFNISDFRGNVFSTRDIIIETEQEPLPSGRVHVWKWKYRETPPEKESQHLYRNKWENMVVRAGFAIQKAKRIIMETVQPVVECFDVSEQEYQDYLTMMGVLY